MKRVLAAAAAIALTMPAAPALSSTTLTIQNITGAWSMPTLNPASGTATIAGDDTAAPTIRWGDPRPAGGNRQSGYDFNAVAGPIDVILPPTPSDDFELGTFTHLNYTIGRPFLTSVVLSVTAEILINGVSQGEREFDFNVQHTETPNANDPCPFGGDNGQGVNVSGCADRVRISIANTTETFIVAGEKLTLNILGFQVGGNFTTDFLTVENQANVATLLANVTVAPFEIPVPTPMSLALFATGLFGLAGVARRRKA
jgi:hypothetical protein